VQGQARLREGTEDDRVRRLLATQPGGKVLKKDLRAKYWQDVDRKI
jgi:hypothetical protein